MKRFVWNIMIATAVAAVAAACGSDDMGEPAGAAALEAPAPVVTVSGGEAVVRWVAVENAHHYSWEIVKNNEGAPQTGDTYATRVAFAMEESAVYSFRVKSVALGGSAYRDSEWSEYLTVSSDMLAAPHAEIVESSLTDAAATLKWSAVEDAAGYRYELTASGKTVSGATDALSVSFDGLTAGTAYRFRVMATSAQAGKSDSAWSEYVDFRTRAHVQLAAPAVTVSNISAEAAVLSWSAVNGAVKYAWELREETQEGAPLASGETATPEYTASGLKERTSYFFCVKALADAGDPYTSDSEFSAAVNFRTRSAGGFDLGLPENEQDGVIRAFPGAEGGGMYTTGGRGGRVIHVTNLNDSGAGSLRAALGESGARTIVFDVAGDIILKSDLAISRGDVTVAGQTAPGDGVCVRGGTVQIKAGNIIIRYMRFRLGDESSFLSDGSDAFWGRYNDNIIIDHCSMSWSVDEVASFYANRNFTMQWCLAAEAMRNSVHGKGGHGYGGIWGGKNASFHHNMLAHNDSRNARIDHPGIYGNYLSTHRGNVDYRNNVIYNWGGNSTYGGEDGHFNIVGNYYKPGPASAQRKYFVDADAYYGGQDVGYKYPRLYVEGNYHAGSYAASINADQWSGIYLHDGGSVGDAANARLSAMLPIRKDDSQSCYTTTHVAGTSFDNVLKYAGASLHRDAVDARISEDARTGTAKYMTASNGSGKGLIDSQKDVGGWPVLKATDEELARTKDTDGDGIPDYWEDFFDLDRNSAADGTAKTLDPQGLYTNLEIYLHYLVKDITRAQTEGGTYLRLE